MHLQVHQAPPIVQNSQKFQYNTNIYKLPLRGSFSPGSAAIWQKKHLYNPSGYTSPTQIILANHRSQALKVEALFEDYN